MIIAPLFLLPLLWRNEAERAHFKTSPNILRYTSKQKMDSVLLFWALQLLDITMVEVTLVQFLGAGIQRLAATTSFLTDTCSWNPATILRESPAATWRGLV